MTHTPGHKKPQAERQAAYVEAYKAYKRGERKCPSRWEFNVSAKFAESAKKTISNSEEVRT